MHLEVEILSTRRRREACVWKSKSGPGRVAVANEGFWGIGVAEGERYNLSFWAKGERFSGPLVVSLETADGKACSKLEKSKGSILTGRISK